MEKQIIRKLEERDESVLEELMNQYGNYCKVIARNILGNAEDSEECVNDAYLKVWNSIPPNKPDSLCAYIGKITRNLAINRYQKNNAKKRSDGNVELVFEELESVISGTDSVSESISYKELVKLINTFLGELPKLKRQVFVRRYWYADSITSIADSLGISKNRTSVMLNRILKSLRTYLQERGYFI